MISPPSNTTAGADRRAGFLEGLADTGLEIGGRLREGDWSKESGEKLMAELLDLGVDGVFVGSDRMAVGALRAIRDAGTRCPEDVSVVSFDGIIPPDQAVPQLTSVAQPVVETGERAATMLHAVIRGDLTTPEQVVLPTELVVRESCGARLRGAA